MRRRTKMQWFSLTILITVTISGSLLFRSKNVMELNLDKTTHRMPDAMFSLAPVKHVTKSLAELGKMDEINKHVLFLNHVPKCGSEILILLLQKMQGLNNYRHVRLKGSNKRHLKKVQQEELVDEIYEIIRKEAIPLSFDRHVYFVNFTLYDKQLPTYVNLIRNPVDRIVSRTSFNNKPGKTDFYFKCLMSKKKNCNFKSGHPYDLSIPYFCGHNSRCMLLNNEWALQTAKGNVEKYYPVVGVLEELNTTLKILEHKIPYFFKGVQRIYHDNLLEIYKNKRKPDIPKIFGEKLRETLVMEYDFYEWIRSRLLRQMMLYKEYGSH